MAISKATFALTCVAGSSQLFRAPLSGHYSKSGIYAKIAMMRAWPDDETFVNATWCPNQEIVLQMDDTTPVDVTSEDYLARVSLQPSVASYNAAAPGFTGCIQQVSQWDSILSRAPIAWKPTYLAISTDAQYQSALVYVEVFYQLFEPTELQKAQLAFGSRE